MMDNAPYHSRKLINLPSKGRRNDVIEELRNLGFFIFLAARGLPNDPAEMTMKMILALCSEYRSYFVKYAVDELAKENGHTILRLPAYHHHFNPIEMLWSWQKRKVRSDGTKWNTDEMQAFCQTWFSAVPESGTEPYFNHTERLEEDSWQLDGIGSEIVHPQVIIPLYDDSSDESDFENDLNDDDSDSECEF